MLTVHHLCDTCGLPTSVTVTRGNAGDVPMCECKHCFDCIVGVRELEYGDWEFATESKPTMNDADHKFIYCPFCGREL